MDDFSTLWNKIRHAYRDQGKFWPQSLWTQEHFQSFWIKVLNYQTQRNSAYRSYVLDLLNISENHLLKAIETSPQNFPFVPTDAFKYVDFRTYEQSQAIACFRSSGTTQSDRSKHWILNFDLMNASILSSFDAWVLPDRPQITMHVLAPSWKEAPKSSLYYMLTYLVEQRGTPQSQYHIRRQTFEIQNLTKALIHAIDHNDPVLILGPSLSFVHWKDSWPTSLGKLKLPKNSRIFHTGGFKGKAKAYSPDMLKDWMQDQLGIHESMIVGEYSMSELSSQLYETNLRAHLFGGDSAKGFVPPPWCKVQVLDPQTLMPLDIGQEGLIAFVDLANLYEVSMVLTGDLGYLLPGKTPGWHGLPLSSRALILKGRAQGASLKGCSLALDMLLA